MTELVPAEAASLEVLKHAAPAVSYRQLMIELLWLAVPVLAEHVLHMIVGLTDTYLANHLQTSAAPATAAIGTVAYVLWFMGLIVGAIATGSTALIARAIGAKHRRLANNVCGQSITSALVMGCVLAVLVITFAKPLVLLTGLSAEAQPFALTYIRLLALSMPFSTVMFVSNACLRGAGDTITPAVSMIVVDIVNVIFSFGLTYGYWGLPQWGFTGIAAGTVIAYVVGGIIQTIVLIYGRGGIRLHLHRLMPHLHTLKRIFRIGIPSGLEGLLMWIAQFSIVIVINTLDPTSTMAAAHVNAIRIESVSYMVGFAVATAVATLVGQNLGRNDPVRASRSAYLGYLLGGGVMTLWGVFFIFFSRYPADWMSASPAIADLTARCLMITGFCQIGFAAAVVFSGALRGAGDTYVVMLINLGSVLFIRLAGALFVSLVLHKGLAAIWVVLATELFIRGILIYARFLQGGWKTVKV